MKTLKIKIYGHIHLTSTPMLIDKIGWCFGL